MLRAVALLFTSSTKESVSINNHGRGIYGGNGTIETVETLETFKSSE
jgi:hypothetical protein